MSQKYVVWPATGRRLRPRSTGGIWNGECVTLFWDNRSTQATEVFFKVFKLARARNLQRCMEYRYTTSTGAGWTVRRVSLRP